MVKKTVKLGVITLGCPKNTADTESLLYKLPENVRISNTEDSEIVLLNTCAFLKEARGEVFEKLNSLKDKKVILTGCMTTLLKNDIFKKYPQIHAVVSGVHYPGISLIFEEVLKGKKVFAVSPEPIKYVDLKGKFLITPPSYAYIKIAEGCDNACSFCLIPKLKGRYRSRPLKSIVAEAKNLIRLGTKELILVAQDCGMYGADLYGRRMLPGLLKKLCAIKGDFWVRVLYIYPERIDDELISVIKNENKIVKYLDIPLQHGDPRILKAMRRPYDLMRVYKKISDIRRSIPDITLRTSLIVGFPGEDESSLRKLLAFINKIDFDHIGVFEYSRERGTFAYGLDKQVPLKIKRKRRERAMLLQQQISLRRNLSLVGKSQNVLIERFERTKGLYTGRSGRFAPEIDGYVEIVSKRPLKLNDFYKVIVKKGLTYDLFGVLV